MVKDQKVSKYYENDCLRNILLLFISLLTALTVKSHVQAEIYFIFLKNVLNKVESVSKPNFDLSEKIGKAVTCKGNFSTFSNLVALILGQSCVKGYRVIKTDKEIKLEGVWGELEAKNCFQRQSFTKYSRQTLVFM